LAAYHSSVGNAVAGGVLATLQSAGAGGYGVAVMNGVVSSGAAVVAAGSGAVVYMARRSSGVVHAAQSKIVSDGQTDEDIA
jgi:ABC-type proline/glycine betaine transport system permease subunit